ncbi:MAG: hypothetical protein IRY83_10730 [Chloroflexi bacterium]|nr:hypothetical protein [Chloroflexota bacterium]
MLGLLFLTVILERYLTHRQTVLRTRRSGACDLTDRLPVLIMRFLVIGIERPHGRANRAGG